MRVLTPVIPDAASRFYASRGREPIAAQALASSVLTVEDLRIDIYDGEGRLLVHTSSTGSTFAVTLPYGG